MNVFFVVKRCAAANKIGSVKYRSRRTEDIQLVKKELATQISTRYAVARIRQADPHDRPSLQAIGTDNADRWLLFSNCNHFFDAIRKKPIVRKHNFAVLACWRNLTERN